MWWELVTMESTIWDDYSKVTASFYLFLITRTKTVSGETHRAAWNSQFPAKCCQHGLITIEPVHSTMNAAREFCKFPPKVHLHWPIILLLNLVGHAHTIRALHCALHALAGNSKCVTSQSLPYNHIIIVLVLITKMKYALLKCFLVLVLVN